MDIQAQSDLINEYFKTTTEPFNTIEWDGNELLVILHDLIVERYDINDLRILIKGFE